MGSSGPTDGPRRGMTSATPGPHNNNNNNNNDHERIIPLENRPEDEQPLTMDLVVREGMNATQKALFACAIVLIAVTVIIVIVILANQPWEDTEAKQVS